MKRILIYGMTNNRGGIESYVMNIYRGLHNKEVVFDFITDFSDIAYDREVEKMGSKVYKIPSKGKHPLRHLLGFYRVLKKNKEYDMVYFNILNAGAAYSMLVPKMLGRKVIVHCHNNADENMRLHKLFKPVINKIAYRKIACSKLAAEYMFDQPEDVLIINNTIDIELFAFDEEKRKKTRDHFGLNGRHVLIHIGRIAPQKNPFFLLDIVREVCTVDGNAVLLYVGTGPQETEVKRYAEEIGVYDNIVFLGMREDIPAILNAGDCFILPSNYEGFGIVLLEAQTNGLPCYTSKDVVPEQTNVNGLVEFIGLNCTAGEWAKRIVDGMEKKYDRASYAASLKGSGFVIEDIIDKLKEIFI